MKGHNIKADQEVRFSMLAGMPNSDAGPAGTSLQRPDLCGTEPVK
jgi:hypothetical protein